MSEEGFAARWSRRKRGLVAEAPPVAAPPSLTPEPPLEEPPALDTLGLDEIGPWLKRRVPEAWKTAALRRIWVADPAIRNFVGLADYAWDWNTPGGAPFYGPLQAVDDVVDLLARAMGTRPADPPEEPEPQLAVAASPVPAVLPPPAPEAVAQDEPEAVTARRRGGRATPV